MVSDNDDSRFSSNARPFYMRYTMAASNDPTESLTHFHASTPQGLQPFSLILIPCFEISCEHYILIMTIVQLLRITEMQRPFARRIDQWSAPIWRVRQVGTGSLQRHKNRASHVDCERTVEYAPVPSSVLKRRSFQLGCCSLRIAQSLTSLQ
jgi:hypothetical protein